LTTGPTKLERSAGSPTGRRAVHAFGRLVQVGVGGDDRRVLAAHLGEGGAGERAVVHLARDLPAHGGRAREGDAVDACVDQRAAGGLAAVHEVEDAGRELRGADDLGEDRAGPRRLLGGLDHHRVPGDQRGGGHADRQRGGEVEGRDDGEDAVGPQHVGVALGGDEAGEGHDVAVVALHVIGVGRDEVDGLLHLEDRLGARLARLEADHGGELEVARADPDGDGAQQRAALGPRRPAPCPGGHASGVDRAGDDLGRRRERAAGDRVVGAGVQAVKRLAARDVTAADDMRQRLAAVGRARVGQTRLELLVGLAAEGAARVGQARAHRPTVSCPAPWPSAPTSPCSQARRDYVTEPSKCQVLT
jgi:hypothetical protein